MPRLSRGDPYAGTGTRKQPDGEPRCLARTLLVGVQNRVFSVDLEVGVHLRLTTNRVSSFTFPKPKYVAALNAFNRLVATMSFKRHVTM